MFNIFVRGQAPLLQIPRCQKKCVRTFSKIKRKIPHPRHVELQNAHKYKTVTKAKDTQIE